MADLTIEQQRALALARAKLRIKETTPVFAQEPAEAEESTILQSIAKAPGAIAEAFTGTERSAGAFENDPEFVSLDKGQLTTPMPSSSDGSRAGDVRARDEQSKLMSGLLMSVDPQQKMDVIKAHIPEATFLQREDGSVIVKVKGQNFWLDKPGVSAAGTVKSLVELSQYVPAMKAGGLFNGFKRLIAGGAAHGATSAGLDIAAQDFGSQQGVNPVRAGIMTGAGIFGEAIPMTYNALVKRAAVKRTGGHAIDMDATPAAVQEAELLQLRVSGLTGIEFPLFRAQKTESLTALANQEKMLNNTLGVTEAKAALRAQNEAAADVVDAFVAELIPFSQNASLRIQKAAGASIDQAKMARKQVSDPLYTQALDAPGVKVDISATMGTINSIQSTVSKNGAVYGQLLEAKKLLTNKPTANTTGQYAGKRAPETNARKLHETYVQISGMLSKTADKSIDKYIAIQLKKVQQQLLNDLKQQVPGYSKAATEYSKGTIPLDELNNSQVGILAHMKPETVDAVRARLFAPSVTNETQKHTRGIISKVDPEAWQMILREELLARKNAAARPLGEVSESRILYRALGGGKDKTTNSFRNALSPKEKSSYDIVMSILEQGSLGTPNKVAPKVAPHPVGISEATNAQVVGRAGDKQSFIPRVILSPFKMLGITDANVIKLSKVMFDPKWNPELRKIKKLGTRSEKSYRALLVLLGQVEDEQVITSEPEQEQL